MKKELLHLALYKNYDLHKEDWGVTVDDFKEYAREYVLSRYRTEDCVKEREDFDADIETAIEIAVELYKNVRRVELHLVVDGEEVKIKGKLDSNNVLVSYDEGDIYDSTRNRIESLDRYVTRLVFNLLARFAFIVAVAFLYWTIFLKV